MESFQREFELSDVLDYVKTGIASVIEDEVTQRFVAEDLKVKKKNYLHVLCEIISILIII